MNETASRQLPILTLFKPPDQISAAMIEDYLLYLKNDKGIAPSSCCGALTGLRFFYSNILDKLINLTHPMAGM